MSARKLTRVSDFGITEHGTVFLEGSQSKGRGDALKSRDYQRRYKLFLQRLRSAREEAGLTQAEAAAKLSRAQSFISKCESGERRVDFVELQIFAELYRKPLAFFETSRR